MDNKPSTRYHPFPTRIRNLYARGQNLIGRARVELSEQGLIAEARRLSGLHDFGDESFLPGLRALLYALNTEAELNPQRLKATLLKLLSDRAALLSTGERARALAHRDAVAVIAGMILKLAKA